MDVAKGEKIKCSISSTSAKNLRISSEKMTVEINFPGDRVPCYLAEYEEKKGYKTEHLVLWIESQKRWVSVKHRTIKSCREVEDRNGNLLTGDISFRVDAALK